MKTSKRIEDENLPNGGAYAILYFRDGNGSPVLESEAVRIEAIEYNAKNQPIAITFIDAVGSEDDNAE